MNKSTHENTSLLPAEEYIPQIMLLLTNNDEANEALCLELITVCSTHSFLTGMVIGIAFSTKNKDNRNRAFSFLKDKLSNKLYEIMKRGIQLGFKEDHYTTLYPFIEANPEIDFCGWYYASVALREYKTYDLNLKNIKSDRLNNIEYLNNGRLNNLEIHVDSADTDLKMAKILRGFNFKWLTTVVTNDYFPIHLLQLPTIKYAIFLKGSDAVLIPDLSSIAVNLTHTFNLKFNNLQIKNIENLGSFSQLKSIELRKCQIENTQFLSRMPLLTRLVLEEMSLSVFPQELEKLKNITYLNIRNIGLTKINFDFKHLSHLREVHISDDALTSVSDTFQSCLAIRSGHISSKVEGFVAPKSLVEKKGMLS
jgi:hypothetical protein